MRNAFWFLHVLKMQRAKRIKRRKYETKDAFSRRKHDSTDVRDEDLPMTKSSERKFTCVRSIVRVKTYSREPLFVVRKKRPKKRKKWRDYSKIIPLQCGISSFQSEVLHAGISLYNSRAFVNNARILEREERVQRKEALLFRCFVQRHRTR